jgi:putative ABC transport system permease protein
MEQKMFLARRNLVYDKTRFALSIFGLALPIMLILLLNGIQTGILRQVSAYFEQTEGSVIVVQDGISAALGSSSMLPRGTSDAVRNMEGVQRVVPILSQYFFLELHERKVTVLIVGYDPEIGGGPWDLYEGREPESPYEIVLDRVLAQRHGIRVDDEISVLGLNFQVVGLSNGTSSVITNYVFVLKSTVESLLFSPEITSFIFVTATEGVEPETLQSRLSELPGVDALLKRELLVNNERLFDRLFGTPLRLMLGIAFFVGAMVVGLVIYTASIERRKEYGVIKAIGAANQVLYQIVIVQALIIAIAGTLLGNGLAWLAAQLIMALRPEFLVSFEPSSILSTLFIGLLMAVLAAVFPVRLMTGLAPAEVFRS